MPFTIVGVMAPDFLGRYNAGTAPNLWIPMIWQPELRLKDHDTVEIMARLKAEATPEQAREDLNGIYQQFLTTATGPRPSRQLIHLESAAHGVQRRRLAAELQLLMMVVGVLLLIACANVANLLLARAANRRKEIAVRVSLGATRWRLVRQLLTESLIIAAAGGVCGLFLAWWGSNLLLLTMGFQPVDYKPDSVVLVFTALISIAAGLLFGLMPAIRSSSATYNPSLAMRRPTPLRALGGRLPIGNVLVVAQIALSLVLVVGALLLTRSLQNLLSVDVGFERDRILVADAIPTFLGYEGERELRLYEKLLERLNAVPGVQSATLSRLTPFVGRWPRHFSLDGRLATVNSPEAFCQPIGPRFFETMGISKLLGREFLPSDTEHAPRVAIVNEALVRSQLAGSNPLGRAVRFDEGEPYTVVGVVKNVKQISVRENPPRMAIYIPFTQTPAELMGQINFEIRTALPAASLGAALRQAVRSVDPDLPLIGLQTEARVIAERMSDERSLARLVALFGLLALLLATVGLYGTVSYALARRTSEIGIRMAIGASRWDVVDMVLRETFLLVIAGFVVGVPVALAASRLVSSRLFGLVAADPVTFGLAAAVLSTVAVVAALVPAQRASRVDPVAALRCE